MQSVGLTMAEIVFSRLRGRENLINLLTLKMVNFFYCKFLSLIETLSNLDAEKMKSDIQTTKRYKGRKVNSFD